MGLLKKVFGRSQVQRQGQTEVREPKEEYKDAECSIPANLKDDGAYAIQFSQAENYDQGNSAFITHFMIYDRKERTVLDITSDVSPAPLLSQTRPVEVCTGREAIDFLEGYLTGRVKPEFNEELEVGVKSFKATELTEEHYGAIRQKVIALREARVALNKATEDFRKGVAGLKDKYFPSSEGANSF